MTSRKRKQEGIDFFVVGATGLGHREQKSGLIWFSPIGGRRTLLPAQVAAVVLAADLKLPGWDSPVTEEWFARPRRGVKHGQKSPVTVLRAFKRLLGRASAVYPTLVGITNTATIKELRSYAVALERVATIFDTSTVKMLERDAGIASEIAVARQAIHSGGLADLAKRFQAMADSAEAEKDFRKPLPFLMPELVRCFEDIFERRATSSWEKRSGSHVNEPNSPFVRFAMELLRQIGAPLSAGHVHTELYKWRKRSCNRGE